MDDAESLLNAVDYYGVLNVPRDASQEDVAKAYRRLAQVFHPDKHQDDSLKRAAQEAFGKLQEAYEVLSDVHKRQIYDIYGKQGLVSGFEVGDRLHSVDELKKEWEEFKRKREQEQAESSTVIKGLYQVVGGTDNVHIQGQAAVRNQTGSGNLIFGYTRPLTQRDTLDGSLVLGLRSLLTLTSTRQLDPFTSASATATWGLSEGLGFQISSTRQLPGSCTAAWAWVLGPRGASGMSLSVSHRRDKASLQGKVELGAVTALSARASLMLTSTITLRAIGRLGSTGIDFELGASKRFNAQTSGYLATVVGIQGIIVKARVARSNQTVEFPIIISHYYDDWRLLAAATVGPPLLFYVTSRFVVRPLVAWRRRVAEQAAREEYAEELAAGRRAAEQERALLAPVAKRKARAEAARGGLVILEAVYGRIAAYREHLAAGGQAGQAGQPFNAGVAGGDAAAAGTAAAAAAPSQASSSGTTAGAGASSGDDAATGLPPPWLRVTEALQYLVVDARLELHPGVSKVGLMGFTDPMPKGQDKQLYVAYWHGGTVREVVVEDTAGLVLGGSAAAGGSGREEAGKAAAPAASSARPGAAQAQAQARQEREREQAVHAVVEEPMRREWLLHQGVQCLGLTFEALAPAQPSPG